MMSWWGRQDDQRQGRLNDSTHRCQLADWSSLEMALYRRAEGPLLVPVLCKSLTRNSHEDSEGCESNFCWTHFTLPRTVVFISFFPLYSRLCRCPFLDPGPSAYNEVVNKVSWIKLYHIRTRVAETGNEVCGRNGGCLHILEVSWVVSYVALEGKYPTPGESNNELISVQYKEALSNNYILWQMEWAKFWVIPLMITKDTFERILACLGRMAQLVGILFLHQKVAGLISGWGAYVVCGFSPQLGHIQEATD